MIIYQPSCIAIEVAIESAKLSPCRSKRGAAIWFPRTDYIVSSGHNDKPRGFTCDGSEACKATCRTEAVHAEQAALLKAGRDAASCDLLHAKIVDGRLVVSGGPSCVECSKLALAAGIANVWLYHAQGWCRYDAFEFHRMSLEI